MQSFGKEEDIVTFLYRAILKRDPDPEGLRNYAEKLRKGELDVPTLTYILYTSEENKRKRIFFRESAKLALWDFLNAIKGTVVYDYLNELAMFALYSKDEYSDVVFPYDFLPDSLIVTNRMIPPRPDVEVYTTSPQIRQLMKMNGIRVIDNLYKVDKTYDNCYLIDPDKFDMIGSVVRKLDEICKTVHTNGMFGYIQQRLSRASLVKMKGEK